MADTLSILANALLVPSGTTKTQPYTDALDAAAYKSIECQIDIPGNAPTTVTIQSSMTRNPDDSSWVDAGSLSSFTAGCANNTLQIPASGKALFRFVRWKIVNSGANNATVSITGLARTS